MQPGGVQTRPLSPAACRTQVQRKWPGRVQRGRAQCAASQRWRQRPSQHQPGRVPGPNTMRPTVVPPLPPLPPGTYVQPRPCSGPKPGVSRRWEPSSSQFQPRKQNNPRPPDTRMKPHRPQSSVAPAETGTEGGARDRRREGGGRARGRHAHRAESLRMLGEPAARAFRFPDAAVRGKG